MSEGTAFSFCFTTIRNSFLGSDIRITIITYPFGALLDNIELHSINIQDVLIMFYSETPCTLSADYLPISNRNLQKVVKLPLASSSNNDLRTLALDNFAKIYL